LTALTAALEQDTADNTEVVEPTPEAATAPETEGGDLSELEAALRAQLEPQAEPEDPGRAQKLNEEFKAVLGVDLQEAVQMFNDMKAELQQMKQQSYQGNVEQIAVQLRQSWGVNDAELSRRATLINEYAAKLPANLRSSLETADGIQLAWRVITQDNTFVTAKAMASATASTSKPVFKRTELQTMMIKEPAKYAAMEQEINLAYQEGRIQ
jgi:hypothetical protein